MGGIVFCYFKLKLLLVYPADMYLCVMGFECSRMNIINVLVIGNSFVQKIDFFQEIFSY